MPRKSPGKPPSQRPGHAPRQYRADHYDANDIRYVATHEAGHAVSSIVLGMPLKSVDINRRRMPNGMISVGFTDTGPIGDPFEISSKGEEAAMPLLTQALTGGLAEMRVNEHFLDYTSMDGDKADVRRIAAFATCEITTLPDGSLSISTEEQQRNAGRIDALIQAAASKADGLVAEHWDAIEAVAMMLLRNRSLSGSEVAKIVEAGAG